MKKALVIILVLAIVAAVGTAGYYGWMKRSDVLFQGDENFEVDEREDVEEDEEVIEDIDDESEDEEMSDEEKEEQKEEQELDELDEDEMSLITFSDCENECEDWEDDDEDLEICQEICGFDQGGDDEDPASSGASDDCEELDDVEADICWRRKAIADKDTSLCDKIDDDSLKKNCENRVLEEIIDNQ